MLTVQLSHIFSNTSTAHGAKIGTEVHENLYMAKNVFWVENLFAVCTVIQFGIVVVQFLF